MVNQVEGYLKIGFTENDLHNKMTAGREEVVLEGELQVVLVRKHAIDATNP